MVVAGGSNINGGDSDRFAIGKRNHLMLRKLFWKNGILVKAEDVGGTAQDDVLGDRHRTGRG